MSNLVSVKDIIKNPVSILRNIGKKKCQYNNCIQQYISFIKDNKNYFICLNCLKDNEYIQKKLKCLNTDMVFKPKHNAYYIYIPNDYILIN